MDHYPKSGSIVVFKRREMLKIAPLFLVMASSIWSTGCNVFNDIIQYVGVGIQAIGSVASLLAGAGIVSVPEGMAISLILAMIKAGFADVTAAVTEYENAPAADKATLKGKISTVLQALSDQIQKFWSDLKIPDQKLSSTVEGLLGLILSTLAGFMVQLPPPVATAKVELKKTMSVTPAKRTRSKFVADFNAILSQNGYNNYAIK